MGPARVTEQFVDWARTTMAGGIPEAVQEIARRQVLDSLGVGLAAWRDTSVQSVEKLIEKWTGRPGSSSRLRDLPPSLSAFVYGTRAHALDFDDTHLPSVLHPSASVVSAAFAEGVARQSSLEEVLTAVAIGNEFVVRLGMAGYDSEARDSVYFARGFHATSICGCLGAALSVALLRGVGPAATLSSVGIAASLGAGLLEANRTGGSVKRMHCGWAAFSGSNAVDLAEFGLTGPPTVLEGRFGFVQAFVGDRGDLAALVEGLGDKWEIDGVGFKPYPANGFTHSSIDAALKFREMGIVPEQVAGVHLGLPGPVLRTVAEPIEEKRAPTTPYGAKFSAPFAFAAALRGGGGLGLSVDDFTDEALSDPIISRLCAITTVREDRECSDVFPIEIPARVSITLLDGEIKTIFIRHRRGSPRNALTNKELCEKFMTNAGGAIGKARAQEAAEFILPVRALKNKSVSMSDIAMLTLTDTL